MDIFKRVLDRPGNIGKYMDTSHGYFAFPKLEGEIGPRMMFKGKEQLVWSLNNYIGLANHPEVRKADAEAAAKYGMAYPMGARMMSGQTKYHEQLEQELADFVGKERGFLLNYGYQGIMSVIDSMADRNDVIVYDSECHASIMDGIFLHKAKGGKSFVFPHNDIARAKKMLGFAKKRTDETDGGILLITEGVFGMAGDMGKLDELTALKDEFDFRMLVDDAHGFGTMGATGAGAPEHFGVADKIDLLFGTFAKSMAGIGAFITGPKEIIDFLQYTMRSQTFAKSLPMPMVMGALKRLELLRTKPELREKLWTVVNALQSGLKEAGFEIGVTNSPVTPVYLSGGIPEATNLIYDLREKHNVFCSVVVYPVVPKDVILLRLIPTAMHTLEDVEYTLKAFKAVKKNLDDGTYAQMEVVDQGEDTKH
ncbi:MAG: pyridoxal phosphate-dependent aminotransferase family protein [Bacteroidetes bacterium]|nr:MAG: pyridoxal phosphate-dependent aminotransferase family protein [Bacteroidota bacterium]